MRRWLLIAVLAAGCTPFGPAGTARTILKAPNDLALCFSPDPWKKTCAELDQYRAGPKGFATETVGRLLLPKPAIVMQARLNVRLRNGAFCVSPSQADFDAAAFTLAGKPIKPTELSAYQDELAPVVGDLVSHETCTAFAAKSDGFKTEVKVDGIRIDHLSQRVIWVRREDGYTVGT